MATSPEQWDLRFMKLAHVIATWSNEKGIRVGAVIVGPDNELRSTGHNGFPRGVDETVEGRQDLSGGERYFWSSHAERNAVYNAARIGVPVRGCRIYIPWFPCGDCAKAIIQSGIKEVVAYEPDFADSKWGKDFERVILMLAEAKVQVRYMDSVDVLPQGDQAPT